VNARVAVRPKPAGGARRPSRPVTRRPGPRPTAEVDAQRPRALEGGTAGLAQTQEVDQEAALAAPPVSHTLAAISILPPAETAGPVEEATPDPSSERPGAETEQHETEPMVGTQDGPAVAPAGEEAQAAPATTPLGQLDQAAAEAGEPLPHRAELEARLGQSLEGVEAHSGPTSRQALAGLGAEAATRGQQVFLTEPSPPVDVVAHEAMHTLQAEPDAEAPRSGGTVVPEQAPVEQEAAELAYRALNEQGTTRKRQPEQRLPASGVALLRTGSAPVAVPPGSAATPSTAFEAAADRPGARPAQAAQPSTAPGGVTAPRPAPGAPPSTAPATTPTTATAPAGEQAVPSLGAAAAPEPGLTPEAVAAQQEAATQAAAALTGADSVTGLVDAFATAPPTVKAQHYASLGSNADRLSKSEESGFQETLPELHAELSGEVAEAEPVEIPTPPERALTLEATAPPQTPLPELPPTPDPGEFTANDRVADDIERSFWEELLDRAARIGQSLKDVQTTDKDIDTSAGAPPTVPLEGENDPERIDGQQQSVVDQARTTRDEAQQAVVNGPGPELVQPRVMDEAYPLGELNGPMLQGPAPVEGPEAYLAMGLPPEVQAAFDQDQQAAMEASLEGPRGDVQAATTERDTSREAEIAKAEKDVQDLTVKSDEKQRTQVKETRDQIQTERSSTLQAQADAVADAEGDIETERKNRRGEIDDRVKKDEQQIRDDYAKADEDAQKEVTKGETKAEAERVKAEREAEDKSWWERAVDFVKDAFEALTSIVGAIFDAVRSAVTAILDAVKSAVLALIDLAAGFIKGLIAAFGEFLKLAVDALIGTIFPELAEKLKQKIDGAVSAAQAAVDVVADGLKAGVSAIVDGLKAGLNKIIDIYQAAVELGMGLVEAAVTGDWGALARKALEAALRIAGISKEEFYGFVGRAEETYQSIVDDPGKFLGNCVDAFVGGVQKFADNFATHLQAGIINWLTGTMGGAGITLPKEFNLLGVLDIARQILGLTWDRLRKRAVALIGEQNVERIELVAGYLQTLIAEGWSALLEQISSAVGNVRDTVFDGIKSYLTESIIFAAIARLATLFNPVGAIVQLILAAWNLYTFLRDQLARIVAVLKTIVGAIVDIARGVIEPASLRVEEVLAGLLPLAIDLLARFLNLGGAAKRFQEIVEGIRERVDKAIDWLIQKVMGLFKGKGGGKDGKPEKDEAAPTVAAAQPGAGAVDDEIGERLPLVAGGQSHHVFIVPAGNAAEVMIESQRETIPDWLKELEIDSGENKTVLKLIAEARVKLGTLKGRASTLRSEILDRRRKQAVAAATATTTEKSVVTQERDLVEILSEVLEQMQQDVKDYINNEEIRLFTIENGGVKLGERPPSGYQLRPSGEKDTSMRLMRRQGYAELGYPEVYVDDKGVVRKGARPAGGTTTPTLRSKLILAYQNILTAAGISSGKWPKDPTIDPSAPGQKREPEEKEASDYRAGLRDLIGEDYKEKMVSELNTAVLNRNDLFEETSNRLRGEIFESWLVKAFRKRIEIQKPVFRFLKGKWKDKLFHADRVKDNTIIEAKAITASTGPQTREEDQAERYRDVFKSTRGVDYEAWLFNSVTEGREDPRDYNSVTYYFSQNPVDTRKKSAKDKWNDVLKDIFDSGTYQILVATESAPDLAETEQQGPPAPPVPAATGQTTDTKPDGNT